MKSCDQNEEAFWSHDYTKFKISIKHLAVFAIPAGDVDSLVILVMTVFTVNEQKKSVPVETVWFAQQVFFSQVFMVSARDGYSNLVS